MRKALTGHLVEVPFCLFNYMQMKPLSHSFKGPQMSLPSFRAVLCSERGREVEWWNYPVCLSWVRKGPSCFIKSPTFLSLGYRALRRSNLPVLLCLLTPVYLFFLFSVRSKLWPPLWVYLLAEIFSLDPQGMWGRRGGWDSRVLRIPGLERHTERIQFGSPAEVWVTPVTFLSNAYPAFPWLPKRSALYFGVTLSDAPFTELKSPFCDFLPVFFWLCPLQPLRRNLFPFSVLRSDL